MPPRLPNDAEALAILRARRTRPAHRAAPAAGRALTPWLRKLEERFGSGPQALQARWREVVGESIARRTEPVKLTRPRGGGPQVLELKVDGPAAAIVQHQVPEILERVNLFLGPGAVGRVRIVQGVVRAHPARPAAKAARRSQPPLDAADEARLDAEVAAVPAGPLRDALRRVGKGALKAKF